MRLLAVTDLHYRLPLFDWLLRVGPAADLVTVSGDLLDIANPVPYEAQSVVVAGYLSRLAEHTTLLVSSGNHDLDGPGADGEQVAGWLRRATAPTLHTDGSSLDVDGIRFTVVPWWDGPLTQAAVNRQLAEAAQDRPQRWVWVYHAPPAGTRLCFDGRRSFPDAELTAWVERYRPDLVLCGHIHQAPWVEGGGWHDRLGSTMVLNPGKQVGKEPPHVWIDLDDGVATWLGLGERDSVSVW